MCDASVRIEDNCTQYGANYKPEGLIQKYAKKLRFAAFGYLNDSSEYRNGGVLRARMKYVGPKEPVPGSEDIPNTAAEWSSSTGIFMQNPDTADAAATSSIVTISHSGVVNYLNLFGKVTSTATYKRFDPVSELYYAATRYFRHIGDVYSYCSVSGTTENQRTQLDGFPVIAQWDDPIKYSCQKNFILGIGDVNTNYDGDVPNTTYNHHTSPSNPIPDDDAIPTAAATKIVSQKERKDDSLATLIPDGANYGTYDIAGLAYYAHTEDLRPGLDGNQTINTYWLDVLEYQTYKSKNQYWYATKYGGFTVPDGYQYSDASSLDDDTWHTSSDLVGSDKRPDNYFTAGEADTMKSGLTSAFSKIVSEAEAATSTALSSPSPTQASDGDVNYVSNYDPASWTGYVKGQTVTYTVHGDPSYTDAWNAQTLLDARAYTDRFIVTCCDRAGAGVPFEYNDLESGKLSSRAYVSSFGAVTGVSGSSQSIQNFIQYLRGDRKQELGNGGAYRTRTHVLGDVVDAGLVVVGKPSATFADEYNAGYSSFKARYASRRAVVYAGANDGMLHALDGTVDTTSSSGSSDRGGKELFAYIPSFVYGDSSTAATSGLAALGNSSYSHHFFVDATPASRDVDFYQTDKPEATANDWHTILVGGLGKGGKGYFALDVTDPKSWTSETAVAKNVLWEFPDPTDTRDRDEVVATVGYSYGTPLIIKTAKYGWVVVVTSGYNNADGKGYFYFVNPRNGELLEKVYTPEGSSGSPINLAHITAFIPSGANFVADALYGADLQGNVWRLEVTGTSGSYSSPVKIATLTSRTGKVQPVTIRPVLEADEDSSKRYILLGTGRLLADSDIDSASQQSFYAIRDGSKSFGGFYTQDTLPDGVSFPLTRTDLIEDTDLLSGISSNTTSSAVMGYYYDLPVDTQKSSGIASRVVVQPVYNGGVVAFAATLPTGDACSPEGTSSVYALSMLTGTSVLTVNGEVVSALSVGSSVRDLSFYSVDGTTRLLAGTSTGTVQNVEGNYASSGSLKRLNWRIVPLVQ